MSDTPIPEGKYLTTAGGLKIHYQEQGPADGAPIVFFHGSGPGASGYSNFKKNYPIFAEAGYRCIVPDLPGYGLSDKPEDVLYINDFFIEVMHDFITALNIEKRTLLGNSLGGAIAIGYALAHPDVVGHPDGPRWGRGTRGLFRDGRHQAHDGAVCRGAAERGFDAPAAVAATV